MNSEGQMPNSGAPRVPTATGGIASWKPSDAVMIALLKFALRAETKDRVEAQRRSRLDVSVLNMLISVARDVGREQERVIDALRAELAETMTHRDTALKEVVNLRIALGRAGISQWVKV